MLTATAADAPEPTLLAGSRATKLANFVLTNMRGRLFRSYEVHRHASGHCEGKGMDSVQKVLQRGLSATT